MTAEIIAVGSELLTPNRVDTNSLYLTDQLNQLGIEVVRKSVIGDDRQALAALVREAAGRVPLVVITGGLGPTEDDVTREAAADALGVRLRREPELEQWLQRLFSRLGFAMPQRNLRQADVLEGGETIRNHNGSAPGQVYARDGVTLILLPGPPRELRPMVEGDVLPRLARLAPGRALHTSVLKIADRPESQVDELAAPVYRAAADVRTTILAVQPGEIELQFRATGKTVEEARMKTEAVAALVAELFGKAVFSRSAEALESVVGGLLRQRAQTLSTAESCTAGLVAKRLTDIPGSSEYYIGGVVCYDDRLKQELVGVRAETLVHWGAVSEPTARELAEGIRARCVSDWGLAVTGIAGPGGGSEQKPVGLVYIAIAGPSGTQVFERKFSGDRDRVRKISAQIALNQLRLALQ